MSTLPASPRADDIPPRPGLRVAVVTETYPPEVNGVAATIARVVDGLRQRQHVVQLVRPRQHALDGMPHALSPAASADDLPIPAAGLAPCSDMLVRGLPIPRYPQLKMGMPSVGLLQAQWTRQPPDLVHLVTEGPLGWSALRAARRLGLPVVSDFRTNFHAYSRHYGAAWLHRPIMAYLRRFHNHTACTMVPTEALRQQLAAAGLLRLQVVARGVDASLFSPQRRCAALRTHWGAGPDTTVVLYVGRLAPEKNLGALVAAWRAMQATGQPLKLVLVGDGPARAALQQQLPEALFAGLRHGEDLAAHYASADAFVFPSLTETYGNVVPEAMASGLAVLAFDDAAAGQLICPGESGMLAPVGAGVAWLDLAAGLVRERASTRALGGAARQVALRLDWARIVGQVEAEYEGALRSAAVLRQPASAWPTLAARP